MKRIGILTGGGDVPGLNAAIKSFVWRLGDESYEILGLRRGWSSLLNIIPDRNADNSDWLMPLNRLNTRAARARFPPSRCAGGARGRRDAHLRPPRSIAAAARSCTRHG